LAWGGDLEPERLLRAYRQGIFPWFSPGEPILWWSPAPRCVIIPGEVHLSKRTRQRYNSGQFTITADQAFGQVIAACAAPREGQDGTWISDEMQTAYGRLHQAGHAHSVEVWNQDRLAGGIYGLALGQVFFGESMFSRETDASKVCLVHLVARLRAGGYTLLDCQFMTDHLRQFGVVEISRDRYRQLLGKALKVEAEFQRDLIGAAESLVLQPTTQTS